ncbi:MAG: hypothetical protein HY864_14955 [Chloroflexi bacterium]|nr:hypothetical protein [Chloroflexota bacterium]
MEQITIQVRNRRKARALRTFLKSLDYVEKVTIANMKIPLKAQAKKADFFASAGIWSKREITLDSLRSSAWPRRM